MTGRICGLFVLQKIYNSGKRMRGNIIRIRNLSQLSPPSEGALTAANMQQEIKSRRSI